MRWKSHVRFGGRAGETHQSKGRQGAPARPLHLRAHLAGLALPGSGGRCLQPLLRRLVDA